MGEYPEIPVHGYNRRDCIWQKVGGEPEWRAEPGMEDAQSFTGMSLKICTEIGNFLFSQLLWRLCP